MIARSLPSTNVWRIFATWDFLALSSNLSRMNSVIERRPGRLTILSIGLCICRDKKYQVHLEATRVWKNQSAKIVSVTALSCLKKCQRRVMIAIPSDWCRRARSGAEWEIMSSSTERIRVAEISLKMKLSVLSTKMLLLLMLLPRRGRPAERNETSRKGRRKGRGRNRRRGSQLIMARGEVLAWSRLTPINFFESRKSPRRPRLEQISGRRSVHMKNAILK
mmetsp:Transcript_29858/g.60594  ORF Transcript_29858/g.60594 Transcript_29858/m.60594 type:complete len:221 (-) Transcript_29858:3834-4496(-)